MRSRFRYTANSVLNGKEASFVWIKSIVKQVVSELKWIKYWNYIQCGFLFKSIMIQLVCLALSYFM